MATSPIDHRLEGAPFASSWIRPLLGRSGETQRQKGFVFAPRHDPESLPVLVDPQADDQLPRPKPNLHSSKTTRNAPDRIRTCDLRFRRRKVRRELERPAEDL